MHYNIVTYGYGYLTCDVLYLKFCQRQYVLLLSLIVVVMFFCLFLIFACKVTYLLLFDQIFCKKILLVAKKSN